jgi:VCBS repeat-containing protein
MLSRRVRVFTLWSFNKDGKSMAYNVTPTSPLFSSLAGMKKKPALKNDAYALGEDAVLISAQQFNVLSNDSDVGTSGLCSIGVPGKSFVSGIGVIGASAQGAKIWITNDGKLGYDAKSVASLADRIEKMPAGATLVDTVCYTVKDPTTGGFVQASVQITLHGTNSKASISAISGGDYCTIEDGTCNNKFVSDRQGHRPSHIPGASRQHPERKIRYRHFRYVHRQMELHTGQRSRCNPGPALRSVRNRQAHG